MSVLLSSIQRFSVHDGPGIRTTVFLKGCGLHCPWCANPECISLGMDYSYMEERCLRDASGCPVNDSCSILRDRKPTAVDFESCSVGAISCNGERMAGEVLIEQILRDKSYYGDTGGVTFSGGEALLQASELEPVMTELKDRGISICIETSLFAPACDIAMLMPYIDTFYIDIKVLDSAMCHEALGGNLETYFENLRYVMSNRGNSHVTMRVPLVRNYTYSENNLRSVKDALSSFWPDACEIFSVHNLGKAKYKSLGKEYEDFPTLSDGELQAVADYLGGAGIPIRIVRL